MPCYDRVTGLASSDADCVDDETIEFDATPDPECAIADPTESPAVVVVVSPQESVVADARDGEVVVEADSSAEDPTKEIWTLSTPARRDAGEVVDVDPGVDAAAGAAPEPGVSTSAWLLSPSWAHMR